MQTSNTGPQKTAFENLSPRAYFRNSFYDRLQNSPYFCVFKYARAVEQKVGNEAENRERDLGHTPYGRVILARFACVRLLRHTLPISLLILRKKTDCFAVYFYEVALAESVADVHYKSIGRFHCRKMPFVNTGRNCNGDEFLQIWFQFRQEGSPCFRLIL